MVGFVGVGVSCFCVGLGVGFVFDLFLGLMVGDFGGVVFLFAVIGDGVLAFELFCFSFVVVFDFLVVLVGLICWWFGVVCCFWVF